MVNPNRPGLGSQLKGNEMKGYRTIATNILFAVVPILELTELRDVMPNDWLPWYSLGVVLANLMLRYLTTTPMGQK